MVNRIGMPLVVRDVDEPRLIVSYNFSVLYPLDRFRGQVSMPDS